MQKIFAKRPLLTNLFITKHPPYHTHSRQAGANATTKPAQRVNSGDETGKRKCS